MGSDHATPAEFACRAKPFAGFGAGVKRFAVAAHEDDRAFEIGNLPRAGPPAPAICQRAVRGRRELLSAPLEWDFIVEILLE